MYIDKIRINNYRNFNSFEMEFHEGLNVIIGSNNSGKTGLLYAINLLKNPNTISVEDFNKNNLINFRNKYLSEAPKIAIEYHIRHTIFEDDTTDESIIRLLPFLELEDFTDKRQNKDGKIVYEIVATIKAVFKINPKHLERYLNEVKNITEYDQYYTTLTHYVENDYSWSFSNGLSETKADHKDVTNIFDLQFISAERSSEEVRKETKKEIEKFIKDPEKIKELDSLQKKVSSDMEKLLKPKLERFSEIFQKEDNDIGLQKGNVSISSVIKTNINPSEAFITQVEDSKQGYTLPLDHNGLGYNNLINIYMLIKLNEIKTGRDFRILCLEEPEAHLHPAMQYKLFKYLRDLDKENKLNQQIFVSTHSSNISAVAGLENMFLIAYDRDVVPPDCKQQSLGKQFEHHFEEGDEEGEILSKRKESAKKHLTKFLDVTRSDMLFADKIILVEGIAEKLLMPAFMSSCGIPYEDEHISIVEIGGKHFEHFLELYNGSNVKKKVLCITDKDFSWFEDEELKEIDAYDSYKPNHIDKLEARFTSNEFRIVTQTKYGKTFEDELFLENINDEVLAKELLKLVISESLKEFIEKHGLSLSNWIDNKSELDSRSLPLISKYLEAYETKTKEEPEKTPIINNILLAELFLHYAENKKGTLALSILSNNDFYVEKEQMRLVVPTYIREGLEWLKV